MAAFSRKVCRLRALPLALVAAAAVCLVAPATAASAPKKITANAKNIKLRVDAKNRAVVSFTRHGRRQHVVVWGAVNGRHPSTTVPQVRFKMDYSGGYMRLGFPLWKTMKNRCRPYDGPRLPWFVAGCKAPDDSYWALQSFRRMLPNLGLSPWLPRQRQRELHIAHWKGPVAKLEVYADWVMTARWHELFGRLTYKGKGVHGFKATLSGAPRDDYGRLIFLDVYNSALGPGWKRENSFLARRSAVPGHFCYHFVPRERYAGYPPGPKRPPAHGERYRLTARGPGVTPFVMTRVKGLPNFDPRNEAHVQLENEMNALKPLVVGNDPGCMKD